MSQNRYTPPGADLRTGADDATLGSGDFEIGLCISEGWAATWANFPLWVGALFVWSVAAILATFTVIGIFLLLPVLFWGVIRFFLAMRDGDASFGDIFSGFSSYGMALGSMLLFILVSFVLGLPAQILMQVGAYTESGLMQFAGFVVNMAVSFLVSPRLAFAPFLTVDSGMGMTDALRHSWQVTERVKWKLIGLIVVSMLVCLAGFLCLIIGLFPASVMAYLMFMSAYRQVVGRPEAQAA
jgi:hypothetical protein